MVIIIMLYIIYNAWLTNNDGWGVRATRQGRKGLEGVGLRRKVGLRSSEKGVWLREMWFIKPFYGVWFNDYLGLFFFFGLIYNPFQLVIPFHHFNNCDASLF